MMRKFYAIDHQGKEKVFVDALIWGGFKRSNNPTSQVKFGLVDYDVKNGRRYKLDHWRRRYGIRKWFVYPHSARPNVINDIYENWSWTTAQFVVTDTHKEIMELYGYKKPVYPVGWHMCEIETKPFVPRKPWSVLFAPIHPRMSDIDKKTNADTFEILQKLAKDGKIRLTVRYIDALEKSGLPCEHLPYVNYVEGLQDGSIDMIDRADLVVSHQTYAFLAVARKVPTIMMNEHIPPKDFNRNGEMFYAKHWDAYKHLLMYPYDLLNTPDPYELMLRAGESDKEIALWRRNMIGTKMFDREEFLHRIRVHT